MKTPSWLMGIAIALFCVQVLAQDSPEQDASQASKVKPDVQTLDDGLDSKAWGIDKGCISTERIRSFRYFEPGAARIELTGGKSVLMRFTNRCQGLRNNGVIYETRTGKLCEGFDSVRVLRQGNFCPIESIEPYVEPEAVNEEDKLSE